MTLELNELLQNQIQSEFGSAADYIWKAPKLIGHETKLELEKLHVYFPDNPDLAKLRWQHESNKLEATFPYMIATGNLFTATSLYEHYLLVIARLLDEHFSKLQSCPGQGQSRIYAFFKLVGVKHTALETYAAVDSTISIRNCLVHCGGVLEWSRDNNKLRDLIVRGRYLSQAHRKRKIELGSEFNEIKIVPSLLGDRVQIDNQYSHLVCSYFRDHLTLLVDEAAEVVKIAKS